MLKSIDCLVRKQEPGAGINNTPTNIQHKPTHKKQSSLMQHKIRKPQERWGIYSPVRTGLTRTSPQKLNRTIPVTVPRASKSGHSITTTKTSKRKKKNTKKVK